MALISISKLSFAHEGNPEKVFENVSFQLETDWKLGFIGRNGRGKTTFLQLLMGKYPYEGRISTSTEFEYFPFPVQHPDQPAGKLIESLVPQVAPWQIERETSLLKLDVSALQRPFKTLSNGEQTKILLASLFLNENRFLLIDEPTNHLDTSGRRAVSEYLNTKKGFILVSHDRAFLDACIDHVLSINRANIEVQQGNFSSWWENKRRQDQFELDEDRKLRKELRRLNAATKRTANWSTQVEKTKSKRHNKSEGMIDKGFIGHKSAKMMARSKTIAARREEKLNEKNQLLQNLEEDASLKLFPLQFHSRTLFELSDLSIRYGQHTAISNFSMRMESGERIALMGSNGSGKSSLLKFIHGEALEHSGQRIQNPQLRIAYLPQQTAELKGSLYDYMQRHALDEKQFKIVLSQLDIPHTQFDLPMETFSMGQKKKIALARNMCEPAHLFLWDEPLNYIDLISRIQIENLLLAVKPSILFVEHDARFCEQVATRFINLDDVQKAI